MGPGVRRGDGREYYPLQTWLLLSPRDAPEFCQDLRPERAWRDPQERARATLRRARGMPGAQCTRSLVRAW
jgi:hypothetical protein